MYTPFHQSRDLQFTNDYFKVPLDLLQGYLENQQLVQDKNTMEAEKLKDVTWNWISEIPGETQKTKAIKAELDANVNQLLQGYQNSGDMRGMDTEIRTAARKIYDRTKFGGDIFSLQANYDRLKQWDEDIAKRVQNKTLDAQDALYARNHMLKNFTGSIDENGQYSPLRTVTPADYADIPKVFNEMADKAFVDKYPAAKNGQYSVVKINGHSWIRTADNHMEKIDETELEKELLTRVSSDPKVGQYLADKVRYQGWAEEDVTNYLGKLARATAQHFSGTKETLNYDYKVDSYELAKYTDGLKQDFVSNVVITPTVQGNTKADYTYNDLFQAHNNLTKSLSVASTNYTQAVQALKTLQSANNVPAGELAKAQQAAELAQKEYLAAKSSASIQSTQLIAAVDKAGRTGTQYENLAKQTGFEAIYDPGIGNLNPAERLLKASQDLASGKQETKVDIDIPYHYYDYLSVTPFKDQSAGGFKSYLNQQTSLKDKSGKWLDKNDVEIRFGNQVTSAGANDFFSQTREQIEKTNPDDLQQTFKYATYQPPEDKRSMFNQTMDAINKADNLSFIMAPGAGKYAGLNLNSQELQGMMDGYIRTYELTTTPFNGKPIFMMTLTPRPGQANSDKAVKSYPVILEANSNINDHMQNVANEFISSNTPSIRDNGFFMKAYYKKVDGINLTVGEQIEAIGIDRNNKPGKLGIFATGGGKGYNVNRESNGKLTLSDVKDTYVSGSDGKIIFFEDQNAILKYLGQHPNL